MLLLFHISRLTRVSLQTLNWFEMTLDRHHLNKQAVATEKQTSNKMARGFPWGGFPTLNCGRDNQHAANRTAHWMRLDQSRWVLFHCRGL